MLGDVLYHILSINYAGEQAHTLVTVPSRLRQRMNLGPDRIVSSMTLQE